MARRKGGEQVTKDEWIRRGILCINEANRLHEAGEHDRAKGFEEAAMTVPGIVAEMEARGHKMVGARLAKPYTQCKAITTTHYKPKQQCKHRAGPDGYCGIHRPKNTENPSEEVHK